MAVGVRENLYEIIKSNEDVAKLVEDNKFKRIRAQRIIDLILDNWSTFSEAKKKNIGPVLERLAHQVDLGE